MSLLETSKETLNGCNWKLGKALFPKEPEGTMNPVCHKEAKHFQKFLNRLSFSPSFRKC